jgi:predicted nucleotidyltransferase component of viral defense system
VFDSVFSEKIREYNPANALEQENVLQELMQLHVLASLSKAGFFQRAQFHGGTCLRVVHGTSRFSEDLDFVLKEPVKSFEWEKYLNRVRSDAQKEGIRFEIVDRSQLSDTVKKAFLKTDSIGKVLLLELPHQRHNAKKLRIRLEIDCNPPAGSTFETNYITFPVMAAITTQTLESGFAGKSHALLCRRYCKGRDWYDFLWYCARKIPVNLDLLENALKQQGPWSGQDVLVTPEWYLESMGARIESVDWESARDDVARFLPANEMKGLELWNKDFFRYHLARLKETLGEASRSST